MYSVWHVICVVYNNYDIQQCVVKYLKCWNFLIPGNQQSRVQTGFCHVFSVAVFAGTSEHEMIEHKD